MGDFDRFQKLVDSVNSHHKNVFLPKGKLKFDKHQTDSCFTIHEHIDNSVQKHYHTFIDPKKVDECNLHSSEELILRFKGNDKIIINNWLNICILAENETVFFFKTLMNKRIIVIRHKSDLYKAKSNFLKYKKELEDLLKKAKNNNDQVNVNIYSKKINDINNKLFENKKRLVDNEQQHLEAIKCEKIWWLTYSINKLKDTKDSKLSDILKKQVKLKETLESVDYFANRKSRLKIIEDKMIVYTNAEKYLQGKKHFKKEDSLAKRSISKQIKILTDERKTIYNEIGHKISFIDVRNILKPKIDKLIQKSKIDGNNNTQIKKHILDESVGQVCESVKSMITNYNNKNIFSFTLRYRKQNKISKNLQLEKEFFKKGSMFGKIFKDVECKKDGKKYDIFDVINKKTTCNLVYDDDRNRYSLYVPQQVEAKTNIKKGSIAIDMGLRVYATCMTENKVVEIGRVNEMEIKEMVNKLRILKDEMKNKKITKRKKKEKTLRRKIKNKVTELHWKAINYITKEVGTVILGDIKSQEILKKEGILNNAQKDMTNALSFYKFKKRLEYKCACKGIHFYKQDEYGSSKICSECGTYNNVGGSKIYKCSNEKCRLEIDRDVNPCRLFIMANISK